ncbi:MAG: hypothetical protein ACRCTR_01510 [Actinomycetota bacterium]
MPRANRRRSDHVPVEQVRGIGGATRREHDSQGQWYVRHVRASPNGRVYRCPGCQQLLGADSPHVVVWPANDLFGDDHGLSQRRHWHTPCWARRVRS